MNNTGYYVIGGQYDGYNHGWARTLLGAKRLARKSQEYWDNWQGWHTPAIYAAEDCEPRTTCYGRDDILPALDARPVTTYCDGKWEEA
jgi:hypothetical protein